MTLSDLRTALEVALGRSVSEMRDSERSAVAERLRILAAAFPGDDLASVLVDAARVVESGTD